MCHDTAAPTVSSTLTERIVFHMERELEEITLPLSQQNATLTHEFTTPFALPSSYLLGTSGSVRSRATLETWLPLGLPSVSSSLTGLPLRMTVSDDLNTVTFQTAPAPGVDNSWSTTATDIRMEVEAHFSGIADVEIDMGFIFGTSQRVVPFTADVALVGHVELELKLSDFVIEEPSLLDRGEHLAVKAKTIRAKLGLRVDEGGVTLRQIASDSCTILGIDMCGMLGNYAEPMIGREVLRYAQESMLSHNNHNLPLIAR